MARILRARLGTLAALLLLVTACGKDAESPVAPPAAPLAVTVEWAVAAVTAQATAPAGDSSQTYSFTATVTGGVAPYAFEWHFGDGTPPGSGNPVTHQFAGAGNYKVHVVVTDGAGTVARSDTREPMELAVMTPFQASCKHSGGQTPQQVRFSVAVTGGTGEVSCGWDFGDGTEGYEYAVHEYKVYNPGFHHFGATATCRDAIKRSATCERDVRIMLCVDHETAYYIVDYRGPGWHDVTGISVFRESDFNRLLQVEGAFLAGLHGSGPAQVVSIQFTGCV